MVYTTPALVKLITNLTDSDISDADLTSIISSFVTPQINSDLMVRVSEEEVQYISDEKDNKIDGTNTIFYTRNFPLGDLDDDGDVGTDDLTVVEIDFTQDPPTRTTLTVSTIDDVLRGKFTLSTAPADNRTVVVSYRWSPFEVNINTPDKQVQLAATHLAAAMAFSKVDPLMLRQLDAVDVVPMQDKASEHMEAYRKLIQTVRTGSLTRRVDFELLPQFEDLVPEAATTQGQSIQNRTLRLRRGARI